MGGQGVYEDSAPSSFTLVLLELQIAACRVILVRRFATLVFNLFVWETMHAYDVCEEVSIT